MSKPHQETRRIHAQACFVLSRSNESEIVWSEVLRDSKWFTEDPKECSVCGGHATHKWNGKGYCHEHHTKAVNAATYDANAMVGRYDRFNASGRLNFGRSLVSNYLPKQALAEASLA